MANKANLANSVLFAPLSDSATTLSVYTGDGALFPAAPFYLTISPKNKWSRKINSEIVLVTAKSTDDFTITRAQKSTTARAFDYGDLVAIGIYKEDLDDILTAAATASDAAIAAAMRVMMPVGFVVTLGVSTNPATLYGFGTWTAITGNVIVGKASSGTFNTLNATGGAETHTLAASEIPAHKHPITGDYRGDTIGINFGVNGSSSQSNLNPGTATTNSTTYTGVLTAQNNTGGGGSHNNLQPYIVKYVWERTA